MSAVDPTLGSIVDVQNVGRGVVRFSGTTSFSTGKWVGIELNEPNGKNDGSVQGIAYFTCKMKYGVFVRPSQVKQVVGHERDSKPKPTARPAVGHKRNSSQTMLRSTSNRTVASSSSPSPRSDSPSKPTAAPVQKVTLSRPTAAKRLSTGAAVRKPAAPSQADSSDGPSPVPSNRADSPQKSPASSAPRTSSPLAMASPRVSSPPPTATLQTTTIAKPPSRPPSSIGQVLTSRPSIPPTQAPLPPQPVDDTELQELRAKIRVLEAKRADDAQHLRELETRLSDAENFIAIKPKLQAKLNSLQTDLTAARRELSDATQLKELAEGRLVDAQEQLEMAMLDKEVAEEKAELAESELEDVRERLAIAEVELEVMKEGEDEEGEGGGENKEVGEEGKNTMAYIQLEKHNERLKEALLKLRDVTQETEVDQRKRISELEKDLVGIEDLQSNYDSTVIKLTNAEVQIEDLKLQLDDALGAEEMLVQLTERNLMLGEKIEEMRITIEDLEALKELNDELEENHIETEKALNEDLEAKESVIREHLRRIEELDDTCQDYEGTINQFRDLVLQLQTELDALRAQTATAQSESASASQQTAAILSLNLKLQSTFSKSQSRNIELELKRIELVEAHELLSILHPYLPKEYTEGGDVAGAQAYLFFARLGSKVDLIAETVRQVHGLPESLNGSVSDVLVGICEMRGRLSSLSTLCKRFAAILRKCDVETYLNVGRLFPDLAPMEKRIDMHIDLLKRDEFREMECVSDIVKIQNQFDHLSETYFDGFEIDLGEREYGFVSAYDHDLDMFAAALGLSKTSVDTIMKEDDVVLEMGGYDAQTEFFEPLQKLLDQVKPAKNLSRKLLKRLEDLSNDGAILKANLAAQMKALSNFVPELVNFGVNLAQQILPHISDVRSNKNPFQLTTVLSLVKQTAMSSVAKDMKPGESFWDAIGNYIGQLVKDGNSLLPLTMDAENVYKISGISPWITRVNDIKASTAVNVEAERKLAQINDEMQGLVRTLRSKDQHIQETSVKIELLERRMEAAKKQGDAIQELESELSKARKQEKAYEEAMEQLQADLDSLEQDNAKLKTMTAGIERQASETQPIGTENVPIEGSLETSHLLEQIDALRGTVRYLRTENSYLKGQDLLREIEALPDLPPPAERLPPTPPLDPSGLSDTDSDSDDEPQPDEPTDLRSLSIQTKLLYRDVIKYSSSPKVVDLSKLNAKRAEANGGKIWMPKKKMPAYQVWERKMRGEKLTRRVKDLLERTSAMNQP